MNAGTVLPLHAGTAQLCFKGNSLTLVTAGEAAITSDAIDVAPISTSP
jgi:hypothetical protein